MTKVVTSFRSWHIGSARLPGMEEGPRDTVTAQKCATQVLHSCLNPAGCISWDLESFFFCTHQMCSVHSLLQVQEQDTDPALQDAAAPTTPGTVLPVRINMNSLARDDSVAGRQYVYATFSVGDFATCVGITCQLGLARLPRMHRLCCCDKAS